MDHRPFSDRRRRNSRGRSRPGGRRGRGTRLYRFDKHQSEKTGGDLLKEIVFDTPTPDLREAMEGVRLGTLWAEAVACARDLINEPPSHKTPVTLGH